MDDHERHRHAEARMRELLDEAGLPSPDDVTYDSESVLFRWLEQKVVIAIDLEPVAN